MRRLDERDTYQDILRPLNKYCSQRNKQILDTLLQYEQSTLKEQEALCQWITQHLTDIPLFSKTKKHGLKEILAGNYRDISALAMIRYGFQHCYDWRTKF